MEFIVSLGDRYANDQATKNIWNKLDQVLNKVDGIAYYRHPAITSSAGSVPDLTVLAKGYQPFIIQCLSLEIQEIDQVDCDYWTIKSQKQDSPFLELDDYAVGLEAKFDRKRNLRKHFSVNKAIVFPLISKSEFAQKFDSYSEEEQIIWSDLNISSVLKPAKKQLNDSDWKLAKSVFQGVALDKGNINQTGEVVNLGQAIIELEKKITLLDPEQHKAAVQIAPGPQRIRGLAGTGKTVVLAKKAAIIHNTPELCNKRILFTFNTQSLYNQAQSLISKYYEADSGEYPDWDNTLYIRHGWGSLNENRRPGVYSDLCKRYGLRALPFKEAQVLDPESPFRACCRHILNLPNIEPFYDYILVDEAQDFPKEFFQLLFRLCIPNEKTGLKSIYWAYDELQSLSSLEIPGATELFGLDGNNRPNVSIQGEDYPGNMEKDIVLRQSYRCPHKILMLAHGIGLGIHAPRGCVQMLSDRASWSAIGYEIIQGNLVTKEETIIFRPEENSPNRISEEYENLLHEPVICIESFNSFENEINWVADSLRKDVNLKKVPENKIVVICLNRQSKIYYTKLQSQLFQLGIRSIIPGIVDATSDFAEAGAITLSTVWRAKGNEAPIVYILGFDYLYEYVEEIENRNLAFTSISRSKGWLRISGSGKRMPAIKKELEQILADVPNFKFRFPDMDKVRRLDATETSRRKKEVKTAKQGLNNVLAVDENARNSAILSLSSDQRKLLLDDLLSNLSPEELQNLINKSNH
jgi:superfamily I DNA and RNA helicase